jgi:hypothetical protein
MSILSTIGVSRIEVKVENEKVLTCGKSVDKEDGRFTIVFRKEEVAITEEGIAVETKKETFYDGRQKIVHAVTDTGERIEILVPIETLTTFRFFPVGGIWKPLDAN